jgi:hypothetical protein
LFSLLVPGSFSICQLIRPTGFTLLLSGWSALFSRHSRFVFRECFGSIGLAASITTPRFDLVSLFLETPIGSA